MTESSGKMRPYPACRFPQVNELMPGCKRLGKCTSLWLVSPGSARLSIEATLTWRYPMELAESSSRESSGGTSRVTLTEKLSEISEVVRAGGCWDSSVSAAGGISSPQATKPVSSRLRKQSHCNRAGG